MKQVLLVPFGSPCPTKTFPHLRTLTDHRGKRIDATVPMTVNQPMAKQRPVSSSWSCPIHRTGSPSSSVPRRRGCRGPAFASCRRAPWSAAAPAWAASASVPLLAPRSVADRRRAGRDADGDAAGSFTTAGRRKWPSYSKGRGLCIGRSSGPYRPSVRSILPSSRPKQAGSGLAGAVFRTISTKNPPPVGPKRRRPTSR